MQKRTTQGCDDSSLRIPIAREGYPFIIVTAILTLLSGLVSLGLVTDLFLLTTIFLVLFFRDPARAIPLGEGLIVSPADGRVIFIDRVYEGRYLKRDVIKISIFMSLFNVHINRAPVDGVVEERRYVPGRFISANKDKASSDNEQCFYSIKTDYGDIGMVQIAGLVARRIVSYKDKGDEVARGERIGLIRFGSRVDLFLPVEARVVIAKGSKVYGGSSVIGSFD